MISIIVCSVNERYLSQLRENINKTVGVEFEFIFWNNLHQGKGICEVYNMLARKARYPILIFAHEDIIFEVKDWGVTLIEIFDQNSDIGMVGVAGCKYKSTHFSGWFTGIKALDCARILHRYPHGDEQLLLKPDESKVLEEVVCLDGVFICCRRDVWEKHLFDEQNLKGFHFYDLDFSLRAGATTRIMVTYEIPMVHITVGGNFGNNWVETAMAYHASTQVRLPCSISKVDEEKTDSRIIRTWFDVLKHFPVSVRNKLRWISLQQLGAKPAYWYPILKFLLYHPLRLSKVHKMWKRK